ncbi:hypothetical protein Hanom_Chr07g00647521 [Helianthus anomalus]
MVKNFTAALIGLSDCKFFLWKEDVDNMFIERSNGTSTLVTFKHMKIKNLGLHNMLLTEENKNLKARTFDTETKLMISIK